MAPASSTARVLMVIMIGLVHGCKFQATIQYLYGGDRLDDISVQDHYFSCNVQGQFVAMDVDGDSVGEFSNDESGFVRAGTHPSFSYTTTLVSVSDLGEKIFQYDSIIVVSVTEAFKFNVRCGSNLGSGNVSNVDPVNIITRAEVDRNQLMIQQLFSGQIVEGSSEMMTHGFVCGVNEDFQSWRVEGDRNDFPFDSSYQIGEAVPRPSPGSPITVYRLAYLHARNPFNIVTIMFVTGRVNLSVSCSAGRYRAQLLTTNLAATETLTTEMTTEDLKVKPSSLPDSEDSSTTQKNAFSLKDLNTPEASSAVGGSNGEVFDGVSCGIIILIIVFILVCQKK